MTYAVLGLGANLGPKEETISQAIQLIAQHAGTVLARSPLYETAPEGGIADRIFLNGAVLVDSAMSPKELMQTLLMIESELGRTRTVRWENRTIDIDILLMARDRQGLEPIQGTFEEVSIPHPRLLERSFALVPAAALVGGWVHPETGNTLHQEAARFDLLPMAPITQGS